MPDITANFGTGGDASVDASGSDSSRGADASASDSGAVVHDSGVALDTVAVDPLDVVDDAGGGQSDATVQDSALTDTGPADTGPADTGPTDAGLADTGSADTGPADTGPADTVANDTTIADTTPEDIGSTPDTAPSDTAAPQDTTPADAGGNGLPAPGPGELVITEILANPLSVADAAGEWFEVCNVSGKALSLAGVELGDGNVVADPVKTPPFPVEGGESLSILPSACFVFGINGDLATNGGVKIDYVYSSKLSLNNSGVETVFLRVGGVTIDEVTYSPSKSGWPAMPNGASYMLDGSKISALANDDGTSWCMTVGATFGAGDGGSPGKSNGPCL